MGKLLKLKQHMEQLHAITVFIRREVKPVQIALLQYLLGLEDLHTGIGFIFPVKSITLILVSRE